MWVERDPRKAVEGASALYTDVWISMGQSQDREKREALEPYRVDADLLRRALPEAIVMHCLPAHRGDEITSEVMDGPQSVVFDQAENRLHAQKALLAFLLRRRLAVVLGKRRRQDLIRTVVTQQRVGTQLEMVEALRAIGCDITQATISRDLRELGLLKRRDRRGRPRLRPAGDGDPPRPGGRLQPHAAGVRHRGPAGPEPGAAQVRGGHRPGHGPGDRRTRA